MLTYPHAPIAPEGRAGGVSSALPGWVPRDGKRPPERDTCKCWLLKRPGNHQAVSPKGAWHFPVYSGASKYFWCVASLYPEAIRCFGWQKALSEGWVFICDSCCTVMDVGPEVNTPSLQGYVPCMLSWLQWLKRTEAQTHSWLEPRLSVWAQAHLELSRASAAEVLGSQVDGTQESAC